MTALATGLVVLGMLGIYLTLFPVSRHYPCEVRAPILQQAPIQAPPATITL